MAENQARKASNIFNEMELLQLILHNLGEGVVVADAEGKFVLWNPEAERIVGKGMTDAPPEEWSKEYGVFDPETKEPFPADLSPLTRALRGERTEDVEQFLRNPRIPEGVYVKVTGRPIRDLHGQLVGGVVVFRDTTADRRGQEALRRLAAIVNSSADGVFGLSHDGRVAEFNHSASALFRCGDQELRGRSAAGLAAPAQRESFAREIADCLKGYPVQSTVVEFERKDKTLFAGSVTLAPIKAAGGVAGVAMIVRDVTEKRRVEAMKDDLLAVASHELRGPASAVQLSLELLKEDLARRPDGGSASKLLEAAFDGTRRLLHLLDECLDVERLRRGKLPVLRLEIWELVGLLREAATVNRPCAERLGVSLETQGLFGECLARVDHMRFLQALTNLITNAVKFSPKGGTVVLGLERGPGRLRVFVADRGPGIPTDFKDRIFERFARPRTAQTERVEGAGLGLSIAKEIVERFGGRIGFDSEPGKGATFYIDLDEARP